MAKIREIQEKQNMVLRKPNQFITSNITGLNRFQYEVLDILMYNSQKYNSENSKIEKTPMGRNIYNINICDLLKQTTERRDMKNMSETWNLIKELKDIRHSSEDSFYGKVTDITIFPYIRIDKNNGNIEYTLEDNIEYVVVYGGALSESELKIKPKGYYTPIEINPNLGFKGLSVQCVKNIPFRIIGLFQFIARYSYLLEKHNKSILELTEEEFRFCTGISKIDAIFIQDFSMQKQFELEDRKPKYNTTSELKRFCRFLEKDMLKFYDIEISIKVEKGIKGTVKNIIININRDSIGYDRLNEHILELESIIKKSGKINGENRK